MDNVLKKKPVNMEDMQAYTRILSNLGIVSEGVCSTAAATADKTVTLGATFSLENKATILVTFTNGISVANSTLAITHTNIAGTEITETAKPIYLNGAALEADVIPEGARIILRYNGIQFDVIGGAGGRTYTNGDGISIVNNEISVKAGTNLSIDSNGNLNATDTTYSEATTSASGLMSAADKTKLNGIGTMGASGSTHSGGLVPDTPSTAGTTKFLREDGTWNVPAGSDFTNVAFLEDASEGAVVPSFDPETDTVHVTAQSLTSAQKTQARTNIDALGSGALTGYATQTWVSSQGYLTSHQDISGLESKVGIEAASGTTLTAEVGKYYRFDSAVSSLAVTLPTISEATTIQGCVFYLTTSSSVTLTFTGGGTVKYQDGYEIKASSTYEINAIWNGTVWVLAAIKIS